MRRKIVVAVLAAALVGVVGAEGIIKARNANLPKGVITIEEVDAVTVTASPAIDADGEQLAASKTSM